MSGAENERKTQKTNKKEGKRVGERRARIMRGEKEPA